MNGFGGPSARRVEQVNPVQLVCVGSAHWDVVGRISTRLRRGSDVPGTVVRSPGGVALNIALSLNSLGGIPLICTVVGNDAEGRELVSCLENLGLSVAGVQFKTGARTDSFISILDSEHTVTAVADCRLLEQEFGMLLEHLGRLTSEPGIQFELAIDGNLPESALAEMFSDDSLMGIRKRYVVASDGKAARARALIRRKDCTVYLNRKEAEIVAGRKFDDVSEVASHLVQMGMERVIVSSSRDGVADCDLEGAVVAATGSAKQVVRILGAGDRLVAAHFLAEQSGCTRPDALEAAVRAASDYVSGASLN